MLGQSRTYTVLGHDLSRMAKEQVTAVLCDRPRWYDGPSWRCTDLLTAEWKTGPLQGRVVIARIPVGDPRPDTELCSRTRTANQ